MTTLNPLPDRPQDGPTGLQVLNPKRRTTPANRRQDNHIFPYYAGYSFEFAEAILKSSNLNSKAIVLDPWNGSGTTTHAANANKISSIGIDLNPSMVVAAKARVLSPREFTSLIPLGHHILDSFKSTGIYKLDNDPLNQWFSKSSTCLIRGLEHTINQILISSSEYQSLSNRDILHASSDLACFYYVALFQSIKSLLKVFASTNPTWVKKSKSNSDLIKIRKNNLINIFNEHVQELAKIIQIENKPNDFNVTTSIINANSTDLPLNDSSIDLILTSPPYCTRIDYAVATSVELAILGIDASSFNLLRKQLLGTTTISYEDISPLPVWGETCIEFLEKVATHRSKASKAYYHKNLMQYFKNLYSSISEGQRVLKPGSDFIIVVQDSYYKDVYNDLPKIVKEMGASLGLTEKKTIEFESNRSMARRNSRSTKYVGSHERTESVIILKNEGGKP